MEAKDVRYNSETQLSKHLLRGHFVLTVFKNILKMFFSKISFNFFFQNLKYIGNPGSGSKLSQNPGSGSKFNVFGSITLLMGCRSGGIKERSSVADPERFDADPEPLFKLIQIRIKKFVS